VNAYRVPKTPKYPPAQLASYELRDYRKALETALASAPEDSADRVIIRNRLLAVVAEQAERKQATVPEGWEASA
jgi:hypothetical protein